jgi:hypothetical protein
MKLSAVVVPRPSPTLHVEVLNDELCIYDWTTQRVHALNASAARVWPLCDGTRTHTQIVEILREAFGDDANALVSLALAEFASAGLIEPVMPVERTGLSRRGLMRQLGLTAAMLPVVSSIVAPGPLQAASGPTRTFFLPAPRRLLSCRSASRKSRSMPSARREDIPSMWAVTEVG